MSSNMEYIRKYRRIPVKKGMTVRRGADFGKPPGNEGRLLSCPRDRCAALIDGVRKVYYPYDLDYFVDGKWLIGKEVMAERQALIDATNKRWSEIYRRRKAAQHHVADFLKWYFGIKGHEIQDNDSLGEQAESIKFDDNRVVVTFHEFKLASAGILDIEGVDGIEMKPEHGYSGYCVTLTLSEFFFYPDDYSQSDLDKLPDLPLPMRNDSELADCEILAEFGLQ